jgi:hypothetical protein
MSSSGKHPYPQRRGSPGRLRRLAAIIAASLIDTVFAVRLREKLDAETGGDKSDAAHRWGL